MGLVLPEVYGKRGQERGQAPTMQVWPLKRRRPLGGSPRTPMHFPERSASSCALIPKALVSCLPAAGTRQTISLSDPSFHHFTRKDLKVLRRCRPAQPQPEGGGSFQQSGKRSRAATHFPLANILIPDTHTVCSTRPHWTDKETEAEKNRTQVSQ